MHIKKPQIIQGGMGFGISDWRLASTVSKLGQLGVVSGTALDAVVARRLQYGDPGGHVQRALEHFPFPDMARRVIDLFYMPKGLPEHKPYRHIPMHTLEGLRAPQELCIVGNFVEVFLSKEGHDKPVGINYLEKIQLPHLPSIYGAMLAGVSVVIMGAGIPLTIPGILDSLSNHEPVEYPIVVAGKNGDTEIVNTSFDPKGLMDGVPVPGTLKRPDFFPIVTTESLANILLKKANGSIEGFIVEANMAGGHNAPPRGCGDLSESGEPVYGPRDDAKLAKFREFGLPFWLAGSYGSPEGMAAALAAGAAGVQVGTAFGLCEESGLIAETRHELVRRALAGEARVFTDPVASPTGFPFKVADLAGSLSDVSVYEKRRRICDIGFLRTPYRRDDGKIGYRCAAEPVSAYVGKGGREEDTVGRKCLCNALAADIGYPQRLPDGTEEKTLVTMGDDLLNIGRFCSDGTAEFSAADVIRVILGT
ncbi:nitronate monooxygenase [Pontiellaceae bacterium B1224]|nr:nitronate monooxygenase [Pontiellaceae bacterium B1224]